MVGDFTDTTSGLGVTLVLTSVLKILPVILMCSNIRTRDLGCRDLFLCYFVREVRVWTFRRTCDPSLTIGVILHDCVPRTCISGVLTLSYLKTSNSVD